MNMIHNDNSIMFDNIEPHLELKDERLKAAKTSSQFYMTNSTLCKATTNKYKRNESFFKRKKILISRNLIKIRRKKASKQAKRMTRLKWLATIVQDRSFYLQIY